ncbi:MAG TPA: lysylphosphatidylglycerol synthase transmembrane domain-containing protein [Tepidisphaeraceae bacterium]|jgi:hypothetical protein|nr:lysylphosphatidylglycerol synthase transmembrane domain-containing protein [Tepidisphaeraceae bacterium]
MQPAVKKWLKFVLRWGVAVLGVWFVVRNISLYDQVRVQDPQTGRPVAVHLLEPATEHDQTFKLADDAPAGMPAVVPRDQLVARSQYDRLEIITDSAGRRTVDVLGLKVPADRSVAVSKWPLLVSEPRSLLTRFLGKVEGEVWTVSPSRVVGSYSHDLLSYPLIDVGLINVVKHADHSILWLAIAIFPLNYLITSFRWKLLLGALEIPIGAARAFQINMVGAFYNTFMPGSTGGDLLKAYYAAKHTVHRTRAVLSVVVDRVVGLLALVLMGGTVAGVKALSSGDWNDPVTRKCLQVAGGSAAIITVVILGLAVYYVPLLRRALGLSYLVRHLPMQRHLAGVREVVQLYGRRPGLLVGVLAMSLPVHAITVISAMAAGEAFGLPIKPGYYWVVVPVVTLAGALPVSPQGAGVMEFFAYLLMRGQSATVADALILTMSLRFVQVFWNLLAGVFVLRGGYRAPTVTEASELSGDEPVGVAKA